jgi:hypothetical protein
MWIAILGVSAVALVGVYACCVVASDADDITEEWNKNWVGQKFPKEDPKTKK